MNIEGPFQVKSIQKSSYGLAFIERYKNMPFLYGLKNKSDFPRYLRRFLHVLRSDNDQEFQSAEVLKILEEENILPQYSNPREQFQNGKAEKCIGDCRAMTRSSFIFLNMTRRV